jgi:hypothetical protein
LIFRANNYHAMSRAELHTERALADAGALILSQIHHCETADEKGCLLAVMNALREMGLHC